MTAIKRIYHPRMEAISNRIPGPRRSFSPAIVLSSLEFMILSSILLPDLPWRFLSKLELSFKIPKIDIDPYALWMRIQKKKEAERNLTLKYYDWLEPVYEKSEGIEVTEEEQGEDEEYYRDFPNAPKAMWSSGGWVLK